MRASKITARQIAGKPQCPFASCVDPSVAFLRVNLILFEPAELEQPLPHSDRRAEHIRRVLRREVGDSFDAGLINGPRGKATLVALNDATLTLAFTPTHPASPASPIALIVGLPRPQTARDILRDATTLGVGAIHFVRTEKCERSYAQSTLWSSGEWRRHLIAGAEQAFDTRLPNVTDDRPLPELLATLPQPSTRLALDNYESAQPLSGRDSVPHCVTLAVGSERGWSARERELLREHGFELVHLGARVLRTETACVAALSLLRAKLHLM
jgi:16S rRNA (uracil1498-N3)-methyltransferase